MPVLDKLDKYFTFKPSSIGNPSMYLGTKLRLTQLSNGVYVWGKSPAKYIKESVSNCEKRLKLIYDGRYVLPTQAANPFVMGYEPELNETPALDPDLMQWMCN
jgi:hypothetical protein